MESDIPQKSNTRVTEATLIRWQDRKVELYIPSDEDDGGLVRLAVGNLIYRGDGAGFFVRRSGVKSTLEPVERGDFMRTSGTVYDGPIRPVDYEPQIYEPPEQTPDRTRQIVLNRSKIMSGRSI